MKNLILLLVLSLTLTACNNKPNVEDVEGSYYSDFTKSTYTFQNGIVTESRKGVDISKDKYTIDGEEIKINGFPFTKIGDGSEDWNGGSAFGRLVKK